jgi:hypothetical protein
MPGSQKAPAARLVPHLILWLFALAAPGGCNRSLAAPPVDFVHDLIPVFTRHGCNAGTCHGAAIGRGGLRLSLYGGDPQSDYESIVRQLEGRRINLAHPEQSLMLLKPTEFVTHGGGTVLDDQSESAQLLLQWIREGAPWGASRKLQKIDITPRRQVINKVGEQVAIRATAWYQDSAPRDVTRWTTFQAEDPSAVEVDPQSAHCRVLRRGRHIVVARYLNEVVPIELVLPLSDAAVDLSAQPRYNWIDEQILARLATLGLPVSPIADDATYLRRVSLDLTGRLPPPQRVQAFLADTNPKKRDTLVDALLDSAEFNPYWTLWTARLLRIRPLPDDRQAAFAYHDWLADQIAGDASYQQLARALILATGDSHQVGPANFYRTVAGPREQAEFFSELFLGSRLRCANCHNHPLDRWTQDDYHGLAAIFANIDGGRIVKSRAGGEVIHPRTLEAATPRIPGERFLEASANNPREQLADWLTDDANPYFAKAIVNRLWRHLMGRGLVEPVDDFRATNPATHPALLDQLADDFVKHEYRLRHTLRLITRSAAYARSANATDQNQHDDRFYSHAARRPLEPEVLADAISDVLAVPDSYGELPLGTRAVALVDPATPSLALDILGRCDRRASCERPTAAVGGLSQKLHLFNGTLLNARLAADESRLAQLLARGKTPLEIIDAFYVAALSRPPTPQEQQAWRNQLESTTRADDQRAFLDDFLWAILTCNEFTTNH